jgi:hypothetical protein
MVSLSKEEAAHKQAIFDGMSPRGQNFVLKRGYDKWNPFLEPKDPIDIRKDKTKRTTQMLVREFLQTRENQDYNNQFSQAVLDIALGLVNDDDRYRAMYEFSCWYQDLLKKEGVQDDP